MVLLIFSVMKIYLKKKDEEIEKLKVENGGYNHILEKQQSQLKKYLEEENKVMKDNKKLKEEIKEVKKEMKTMYHIIMNDGEKYELSDKQPLIKMVQFNIGLMLEKFKEMGAIIMENKKNYLLKMVEGFCYLSDHNSDLVLDMLKNETGDKNLIKSVFDEWYATTFYYDIERDEIIKVDGSDDE